MGDRVCAAIVTYNIDRKIIEVVDSIINQVEYVIIVDNASNKNTLEILNTLQERKNIKIIFNKENNGIARALNQAVKIAESLNLDWILTLDHDSICPPDMIKNMLSFKKSYINEKEIALLTPKVFEINKNDYISNKNTKNCFTHVKDCIQSGSLYRVNIFNKIGCFNEELFIYHVDYEFCERIRENGHKIIQCNNTTLYHEEGYKIPKKLFVKKTFYNNYSNLAIYYITRNTIFMSKKYSLFYSKRILKDFIYILLYDNKRFEKLVYFKKGLYDGFNDKFGKFNE